MYYHHPDFALFYSAAANDADGILAALAAGADATRTVRDEKGVFYDAIGLARVFGSGTGRNSGPFFGVLKRAVRR